MSDAGEFNLETLFASRVPEPAPMRVINRAKYDFAIAYPDPDTVPTEALAECVRGGSGGGGSRTRHLPARPRIPAFAGVCRPQACSRPRHRDRTGQYPSG